MSKYKTYTLFILIIAVLIVVFNLTEEKNLKQEKMSNNHSYLYNHTNETVDITNNKPVKLSSNSIKERFLKKEKTSKNNSYSRSYTNETVDIIYNEPIELSGKTKQEIYEIRKQYVHNSIFDNADYEPSNEVFGQIEDEKPWIENNKCYDFTTNKARTQGPSEESRFIINPSLLVALDHPFLYSSDVSEEFCADKINNLIPKSAKYDKEKNEITLVYKKLPFQTSVDHYEFNGINARDFGYKYAYLDRIKSSFIPKFKSKQNISNYIIEFKNYIHTGGSCGIEGGCNNGSPRQPYLEFEKNTIRNISNNGIIYIKLWKKRPISPFAKPDIAEKIIIENY